MELSRRTASFSKLETIPERNRYRRGTASNGPISVCCASSLCYDYCLLQRDTIRSPGLDLLRAVAILLVVTWHIPPSYYPFGLKPPGWIGVDLFFVLSGYLIGSQLLRPYTQNRRLSFAGFYVRRALRILPAYIAVVIVYFTVPAFREQPSLPPLWKFLTFTQNFGLNSLATGAFSNAWSLCVEEHFYLMLPLIVIWLMKRPSMLKTALFASSLFVCGVLLRCLLWMHYVGNVSGLEQKAVLPVYLENIYYPTYARLDGLLAGVLLAAIGLFRPGWWSRIQSQPKLLFSSGTIFLSISVWICRDMHSFSTAVIGFPLLAISFGLLLISSLTWDNIPLHRAASAIATLAYSIYLTHKPIMHLVHQYGGMFIHNSVLLLLVYPLSILAGATILHFCVERPFLKLRGRIVRASLVSSMDRGCDIRPGLSSASALAGD